MICRAMQRRTAGSATMLIAAALLAVGGAQLVGPSRPLGTGVPTLGTPTPQSSLPTPQDWNNTGSTSSTPPPV